MPAYDFRCTACDEVFEIVRPQNDAGEVRCPDCGSPSKRVFTPVGVVFKGAGFHSTDYKPERSSDSSSEAPAPCGADKPASVACGGCAGAE